MDMQYSRLVEQIPPSGIRRFFDLLSGQKDIISLGVGEPDFVTPWSIREEAFAALDKGLTSYTANRGLPELRREIAKYLAKYKLRYDPETEILITIGVSEAVDIALRALLNPGDEVIVASPCYVSYQPLVMLAGGQPITLDTSKTKFIPTAGAIAKLITPRTKALFICSPNNPTGTTIPEAELRKIAALVRRHKIFVLSDEVYAEITYSGQHSSIGSLPGLQDQTIVLNGFSKAFAMTGWRVGYVCCPAPLLEQILKLHQYCAICAPIMSQYGALEALRHCQDEAVKMRRSYLQRRNFMLYALAEIGLPVVKPTGSFYVFVDIRRTGLTSEEFALRLLEQEKVAVVPGDAFGAGGEGFVRCCYATELVLLKEALRRIKKFHKNLSVL
ncbi:aromatic amino acid aminotransferase [Candidatus Termititenax persephonae]|uniref:Aminotransferase n=1 Tax=Candidatus Termititenax persephonae TaxID=2218525 RepID=A0A388TG05_9BACT|nr:aromatic amino acid aminotransferase [Candidatus Termititenax persephonae]